MRLKAFLIGAVAALSIGLSGCNNNTPAEPAHEHVYGEWTEILAPTCIEEGKEEHVCECGEKEERDIDVLGHLPKAEWEQTVAPTVDAEGEEALKCQRCNAILETRKIDKLEHIHVFGEWTQVTAPTCTEKGKEEHTCACGEKEERDIDALGHKAKTEWEVTIPATEEAEGEEVLKCQRCNAILETRKIDKLEPPIPVVNPITLTDANLLGYAGTSLSYGDGNQTVNNIKFVWIEIGAYGNGLQMRTKSGKSSTIYNEDALPGALKSIKITLDGVKQVYANEHALTFTFGDTAACDKKEMTWDTVADQKVYEFDVGVEGCNYFKLVHSITYSLYVNSIELIF